MSSNDRTPIMSPVMVPTGGGQHIDPVSSNHAERGFDSPLQGIYLVRRLVAAGGRMESEMTKGSI